MSPAQEHCNSGMFHQREMYKEHRSKTSLFLRRSMKRHLKLSVNGWMTATLHRKVLWTKLPLKTYCHKCHWHVPKVVFYTSLKISLRVLWYGSIRGASRSMKCWENVWCLGSLGIISYSTQQLPWMGKDWANFFEQSRSSEETDRNVDVSTAKVFVSTSSSCIYWSQETGWASGNHHQQWPYIVTVSPISWS